MTCYSRLIVERSVSDYMSQLAEKDMAITKEKEMLNEVEKAAEVRDAFIKHLKSQDSSTCLRGPPLLIHRFYTR